MTNMFKPKLPAMSQTETPSVSIPTPKPLRMPNENDMSVMDAAKRTRAEAMRRRGRQSTILTDASGIGSSGQKLGA